MTSKFLIDLPCHKFEGNMGAVLEQEENLGDSGYRKGINISR